jgi:gliding motility-associated-like protein
VLKATFSNCTLMKQRLIIVLLFFTSFAFSQQEASVWYFGDHAGIKFHPDGSVTPLSDGKLVTDEGCSSIADKNGNLLFYSDGRTVWDKNHVIMPNGDYFGGTGLLGDISSTQSAIIVPKPGNPNLYYIFTIDEPHHENAVVYPNAFSGTYLDTNSGKTPNDDDGLNNGMNYSIVDLSKIGSNGSIGDVISRNNPLITYDTNPAGEEIKFKCSEKITAVQDIAGDSYWVITQFIDKFFAFKVTQSGVVTNPVVSTVLPNIPVSGYRRNGIGYLKASPNGKKLAIAHDQKGNYLGSSNFDDGLIYLYDFDIATGIVSKPQLIFSDMSPYGVEFSNDSNVLYISYIKFFGFIYDHYRVSQFNLLSADIPNSQMLIYSTTNINGNGALQLGPNNKIYCSINFSNSLGVINNPNVIGLGCDFNPAGQLLAATTSHRLGLPPFITSYFDAFFNAKKLCLGNATEFTLNSSQAITSASWDFGDGNTSNAINPTHTYASAGTYSVTVTANGITGTGIKTKDIVISKVPISTQPQNLLICDNNNDGLNNFDLTTQNTAILNGQDPSLFTVNYFANATDYTNNVAITTPKNYVNAIPYQQQTIVAEVSNNANTVCKSTTNFDIDVFDSPIPSLPAKISKISLCDNTSVGTDTDGRVVFDLTQRVTIILNGQAATQFTLSYYKDSAMSQVIVTPVTYQNMNPSETIYVKMTNKDNVYCFATTSFQIEVLALPVITSVATLKQCDDNQDGFSAFNLEETINKITANAVTETIAFFRTQSDAQNNTNPIIDTTAYTNQIVSNDVVYVRVTNSNGCFRIAQLNLIVSTTQIPLNFAKTFTQCDDAILGTNTDGITSFDFSSVTNQVQAIFPLGQLLDITYYRNLADALAEKNAITDIANYRNIGYPNTQNIYIRVDSRLNNDCLGLGSYITLNVETIPVVKPIVINHCDDNQDGKFLFDTINLQTQLLNGLTNVTVAYFDQNNVSLPSPLPNPFNTTSQTLKVVVTNNTPKVCSFNSTIQFVVDVLPEAFPISSSLTTVCDDEADPSLQDGKYTFDTSNFQNIILGTQTGMTVKYFDGNNNPLSSPLPNPFITATQNVRVEVVNPVNTTCNATVTLPFIVNPVPKISLLGDELVCSNLPTFTKVLDAGILDGSATSNYSYVWSFNGATITGETNYNLTVNKEGIYTVEATNNQGCSRTRVITVTASDIAKITAVTIVDLTESNSISVTVTGAGDYVYGLDEEFGTYQKESVFNNVSAGIHTVFVKDLNGCGVVPKEVAVLGVPNFFTPNDDGYNDYWNIKGVNASFNAKTIIYIFDRYGKLISQISPVSQGWDGKFNGQQMSATDYWYSVQMEDGRVVKGHFSLKR